MVIDVFEKGTTLLSSQTLWVREGQKKKKTPFPPSSNSVITLTEPAHPRDFNLPLAQHGGQFQIKKIRKT